MGNPYSIREAMPAYSEEDCEGALYAAKWPAGYRCPRCAYSHSYHVSSRGRKLFECGSCGHQTSLTAGTILEGTRTPLRKWFQAIYLMRIGISAKRLSELIQVTYKTAWLMNHKLRYAIEQWDAGLPLEGDVRLLAELYGYEYHRHCGSKEAQTQLRPQSVMIGASMDESDTMARLKIKCVVNRAVAHSAFGCGPIGSLDIHHFLHHYTAESVLPETVRIFDRANRRERTMLHVAWQESVRWMARTFGGIGPKHLQAYLNEFCFRRMLRNSLMGELIEFCGRTKTITYGQLVGKSDGIHRMRWGKKRGASVKKAAS